MSDASLTGMDMLDNPDEAGLDALAQGPQDTPFDTAVGMLSTTHGERLELMCRATKSIAEAATVSYNMQYRFHSGYIRGRIEQIERLSVSISGQGRGEIVQSLQAGSGVPGEFYESSGSGHLSFASAEDAPKEERCPGPRPIPGG